MLAKAARVKKSPFTSEITDPPDKKINKSKMFLIRARGYEHCVIWKEIKRTSRPMESLQPIFCYHKINERVIPLMFLSICQFRHTLYKRI